MEHSHADHGGVHNWVLGNPEETPHLGLDAASFPKLCLPTSLSSLAQSLGCPGLGVVSENPFSLH